MKEWIEFIIEGESGCEEIASYLLIDNGSPGVEVEESEGTVKIKGYFSSETTTQERVSSIKEALCNIEGFRLSVAVNTLQEKDWGESWKKHFKPVRVGKRIIIKPPWEEVESRGKGDLIVIVDIDPGMAFGTGTHSTTRMVLKAIEELIPSINDVKLLDVGCGSGILSIAAVKLGAKRVVAIDLDPVAIKETKRNLELNFINTGIEVRKGGVGELNDTFSIVVANINAETLEDISRPLAAKVGAGGFLVLSGILKNRAPTLYKTFISIGLKRFKRLTEKEWVCFLFRREGWPDSS